VDPRTGRDYLRGFDFGPGALDRRRILIPEATHHEFSIRGTQDGIRLRFGPLAHTLPTPGLPALLRHTLLKQALNIHSTLVMGRLGRYEGNLMTWVRPTNGKLVDRSARYVQHLLDREGRRDLAYEEIVRQLFAELERGAPDEPVVLKTFRSLAQRREPPMRRVTDRPK
jgi:N-acetylmuramic acid 6-phosphate etherase